jgi:hypothetical protein
MELALAESFIAQTNYDDAIEVLNKAINIEQNYN